jgi:hypothetical protein
MELLVTDLLMGGSVFWTNLEPVLRGSQNDMVQEQQLKRKLIETCSPPPGVVIELARIACTSTRYKENIGTLDTEHARLEIPSPQATRP